MGERLPTNRLLVWGAGSFHTALLLVVVVLALQAAGGLGGFLDGLSTLQGVLLYAWLWAAGILAARHAFNGITLDPDETLPSGMDPWRRALEGGAVNGWLALPGVILIVFVPAGAPLLAAFFFAAGLLVAPLVGAAIGLVLALVDLPVGSVARRLADAARA